MINGAMNDKLRGLLDDVPKMPDERDTKDEILQWCQVQHELLTEVRRVLLDLMSRSLLVIGEPE